MCRFARDKASRILRDKLPQVTGTVESEVQPIYACQTLKRGPVNRIATIRKSQSRWYSTKRAVRSSLRQFSSSAPSAPKYDRPALPTSRTSQAVNRLTSRAPFASTLRPNLTAGTFCRTAGGYSTGAGRIGGARYFSHTPAAPAQVVNNVSQAVRAFWLSGQKAQFDGMSPRNEKRFKAVSALQDKAGQRMRSVPASAPGSYIDFRITPTITAFGPLCNIPTGSTYEQESLTNSAVLDILSVDFARVLKDLTITMNDLQKISGLGGLPLSLPNSATLRVRFPGCDADMVNRLCKELSIRRGLVYEDEDFDSVNGTPMALRYPFAPTDTTVEGSSPSRGGDGRGRLEDAIDWQNMRSPRAPSCLDHSTRSISSHDFEEVEAVRENPWLLSPSGYSSLDGSDAGDGAACFSHGSANVLSTSKYEGLEGIYRFMEECDRARG